VPLIIHARKIKIKLYKVERKELKNDEGKERNEKDEEITKIIKDGKAKIELTLMFLALLEIFKLRVLVLSFRIAGCRESSTKLVAFWISWKLTISVQYLNTIFHIYLPLTKGFLIPPLILIFYFILQSTPCTFRNI
jgi:hypothetical protein